MFLDEEVRGLTRKLKPVIGRKAEELWIRYLAEDDQGRRDLAHDIQLIAEKFLKGNEKQILLDPPTPENAAGLFLLGDVRYNGKTISSLSLNPVDFIKQIGIFSITGEGKTNAAMFLALQLLKFRIPFLVIDWKRTWRNLLSYKGKLPGMDFPSMKSFKIEDIQVITVGRNVSEFSWNPFRSPPKADPLMWISTIAEVLEKSHISGLGVGALVNRIYSRKFKELKITSDSTFFPNFYDGLHELESLYARERELKWKQTALRIFESFTIGSASKAFNARNPMKLENLLDKPVIIELDLELPKHLRTFVTEIILRWIHLYRLGQGESEKIRHNLFLEEVHNIFPTPKFGSETHSSLENVSREIRATGQGLTYITQHPSLLPVWLLGNCHTQIYLGLQHENDIRAAKQALFLRNEEQEYLNMLKVGEAIVKVKNRIEPCLVKIPLVPLEKNITDETLQAKVREGGVITPLDNKVNTPAYLPEPIDGKSEEDPGYLPGANKREGKYGKYPAEGVNTPDQRLLADIHLYPMSGSTERYRRLGINPKTGNREKNVLIAWGMIQPRKIITASGWITLFELAPKGRLALRDSGHEIQTESSESIEHKYWKHKIAEYYKSKRFDVLVEEHINGKPDIIVLNKGKKTAVEIETGHSDVLGNIEKNIKAGFQEIICVATNKDVEGKIKSQVQPIDKRVRITSVFEYS